MKEQTISPTSSPEVSLDTSSQKIRTFMTTYAALVGTPAQLLETWVTIVGWGLTLCAGLIVGGTIAAGFSLGFGVIAVCIFIALLATGVVFDCAGRLRFIAELPQNAEVLARYYRTELSVGVRSLIEQDSGRMKNSGWELIKTLFLSRELWSSLVELRVLALPLYWAVVLISAIITFFALTFLPWLTYLVVA